MSYSKEFISPKLTGKRFEDHTMPIDLFEDFAAFEELLIQVAKFIYLEENSDRQRVPRGFTDGISLQLAQIQEGSVVPKILLVASMATANPTIDIFPNSNIHYFDQAKERILKTIDAAGRDEKQQYIPENLLAYFNKIGKHLHEDETIDFSPSDDKLNAKLNNSTRKKLVLSSAKNKQFTKEVQIYAIVPELDKDKRSFTISHIDQRISLPLSELHYEAVLKAFMEYEQRSLIFIKGIGRYNSADKLEAFESIENLEILESSEVSVRLNYLSELEDGWYHGEGLAIDKDGLDWFLLSYENYYDKNLMQPAIFPTVDGNIQAEWSKNLNEVSLKVDTETHEAFFQSVNIDTDQVTELSFDLGNAIGWQNLNQEISKIIKND